MFTCYYDFVCTIDPNADAAETDKTVVAYTILILDPHGKVWKTIEYHGPFAIKHFIHNVKEITKDVVDLVASVKVPVKMSFARYAQHDAATHCTICRVLFPSNKKGKYRKVCVNKPKLFYWRLQVVLIVYKFRSVIIIIILTRLAKITKQSVKVATPRYAPKA
jgi:hypothetical protein